MNKYKNKYYSSTINSTPLTFNVWIKIHIQNIFWYTAPLNSTFTCHFKTMGSGGDRHACVFLF